LEEVTVRDFLKASLFVLFLLTSSELLRAQTAVLTRSYDNGRTGANMSETVFTPAIVATNGLKKIKSLTIDDDPRIEAQPLYVPNLTMKKDGKKHNVIFVASMGNHVYAFDADAPEGSDLLWKTPLGAPYEPPATQVNGHRSTPVDSWGINIGWGILSTPVIDLDANKMYAANWMVVNGNPAPFMHQLGLADGKEIGKPKPITGAILGSDGQPKIDARGRPLKLGTDQKERAALLLVPLRGQHKTLFLTTTGGENPGDPHGWMIAFDVDTFTETAAWAATQQGFGGGMWMGSQGPSSDVAGNVYAMTGNGGFDIKDAVTTNFNGTTDFAEAFVKLKYEQTAPGKGSLTLADWFIAFLDTKRNNVNNYDYRDQDLGAAAPVLPPNTDLIIGAGKDGLLYVLDRNHLGQKIGDLTVLKTPPLFLTFDGIGLPVSGPGIDFAIGEPGDNPNKTHHLHGSPVYWNGPSGPMIFDWGENESLRAWKINSATGAVTFVGKGAEVASADLAAAPTGFGGMTGGMLALSSNGTNPNTGIVWSTAPLTGNANTAVVPGIARAYDATVLDPTPIDPETPRLKLLWDSSKSGVTFHFSKFCLPVVADGRLLVPTYDGRVDVYVPNL
jgi:hypothetical protein